ncbi:hypothetical protein F5Y10DRAFT_262185 [Nemania abortiva]|nr:hypothetical protein F5Y10DRAFT_262185 [Nemania abortiva]
MPRKPGYGDPSKARLGGRKQRLGHQDFDKPSSSQDDDVPMTDPLDAGDNVEEFGEEFGDEFGAAADDGGDTSDDQSGDSSTESDDEGIVDATDVRYADSDEAIDHTTRAAIPLRELLNAITYEEVVYAEPPPSLNFTEDTGGEVDVSELEGLPSELIDDVSGAQPQQRIIPELLPKPKADLNDPSEIIPSIQQNKYLEISQFEKALTAYIELTNMSRRDYASLVDVLRLITGPDGEVHPLVAGLPKQLSTLRDRLRRRLPLMKMRKAEIPLNVMKLPTLPPGMKADEREKIQAFKLKLAEHRRHSRSKGKGKDKAIFENAPPTAAELRLLALDLPKITMNLTFFDPISVFKNFIASDIVKGSYSGPGTFVDNPTELYHSNAWLSSIRASSGHYAHVSVEGQPGPAIFPSEFIYYWCTDVNCFCQAISEDSEDIRNIHIGRVIGFGWDKRTDSCTLEFPNELALQIQEAFPVHRNNMICVPIQDDDELVLTSTLTYIPESRAFSHAEANVFLDCHWGEKMTSIFRSDTSRLDISRPKRGAPPNFPKYDTIDTPWVRNEEYYVVRRIIVGDDLVPICHTHPPRAELELKAYGRELYADKWDSAVSGNLPVVSFPMLTFIDGFGVYRNSYRTLMGFYFTPAALKADERLRPGSIFPLVLGPHASDFGDVIAALRTMAYADHGIVEDINGQDTRICAFTMAYIGDMPQQAENSGLKGPRATRFCRFCNIIAMGGQIVDPNQPFYVDVNQEGRFHNQTLQMQKMMQGLRSEAAKEAYGKQWGLSDPSPALATISPALDLIVSRPMDPAHSEFSGLSTLAHYLLRDGILTKDASLEYALQLRVFPFPPGWQRLQSPIHHLASYDMSSHAQWSIIIPILLRQWLKPEHIKAGFVEQAENFVLGTPVIDLVIGAFTKIIKSNVTLMGREVSTEQRDNMARIIQAARYAFNQLAMIAAASGGRSQAASRIGTPARAASATPGPSGVVGGDSGTVEAKRSLASQFANDTLRPNIHIGMHYPIIANEYGLPVNVNTFTGENLHRWFKDRVFGSNYSNIEHVLLMKMNFQETLRLVLRGAFAYDDPELTEEMAELYQKCPSLFARVLSRADQMDIQDDSEYELDVSMSADNLHANPTAINRLPSRELAKHRHDVNNGQNLPLRSNSQVVHSIFRTHLRTAYHLDYGKERDYPSLFENRTIQWSRKFGFTSKESGDRFVFGCGQYVMFSREGQDHVGRVDHVMVFENFEDSHIFIVLSKLNRTGSRDRLLDLEVFEQTDEAVVVGIPAIKAQKLYMVHIDGVGVVLVDWDLYCL